MTRRQSYRSSKRVGSLTAPICAREDCQHHRLRHGRRGDGTVYCTGSTVWPHKDPTTGADVAYSHCGCPGFIEQQST